MKTYRCVFGDMTWKEEDKYPKEFSDGINEINFIKFENSIINLKSELNTFYIYEAKITSFIVEIPYLQNKYNKCHNTIYLSFTEFNGFSQPHSINEIDVINFILCKRNIPEKYLTDNLKKYFPNLILNRHTTILPEDS